MKKQFLIVGIGGIGVCAASSFAAAEHPFSARTFSLALDTDESALNECASFTSPFFLGNGKTLEKTVKDLGEENLAYYFPCDPAEGRVEYGQATVMNRGANRFRMKAMVAFADFLADKERRGEFDAKLNEITDTEEETETEVYTVASLAGGTGSALFMPVSLYIARAFRQKGRRARFFALLATPDILPPPADAVQRTKENANAYAALRELHAAMAAEGEKTGHFRLGREEDPYFGRLFPLESEGEQRPFTKVFFMDKRSGVSTVDSYAFLMAEVLEALCTGAGVPKEKGKEETAFYAGISLAELIYPLDSLSDYVVGKRLWEQNEKWLPLFVYADRAASGQRGADSYARRFLDMLAEKTEEIRHLFPELQLTGREETVYDRDISSQILVALRRACHKEGEEEAEEDAFSAEKEALSSPTFRFPLFAGNKVKKEKRGAFYRLLLDAVKIYEQASDRCAADFPGDVLAVLDSMEKGPLTALIPEGLPPLAATIRLCALRVAVEEALDGVALRRPGFGEDGAAYLGDLASCFSFSAQVYNAFGEEEKVYTLSWNKGEYENGEGNPAKDAVAVLKQLERGLAPVYAKWESMRHAAALSLLAVRLDGWIAAYTDFLSALAEEQQDLSRELPYLKQAKTQGGGFILYTGADAASKDAAALAYTVESPLEAAGRFDAATGMELWRAILSGNAGREDLRAFARRANREKAQTEMASFRQSATYQTLEKKDMLSFLTEGEEGAIILADLLGLALPTLPMEAGKPCDGCAPGRYLSTLLLPSDRETRGGEEIAEPRENEVSAGTQENKATAGTNGGEEENVAAEKTALITALLTRAGCFDAGFSLDVPLKKRTVLAVGCKTHFRPADLVWAGECGTEPVWYLDCLKAEENSRKYNTAMWCPYLSVDFGRGGVLPYLDGQMTEIAIKQAAKAFLAVFLSGSFCIREEGEEGAEKKEAICLLSAGNATTLRAGGKAVAPEDCDGLAAFLTESDSRRVLWADRYDAIVEKDRRALPSVDAFFAEKSAPARALASTLFMRVFGENVFRILDTEGKYPPKPLALLLYDWENRDAGKDKSGVREAVYTEILSALVRLCEAASVGCEQDFTHSLIRYGISRLTLHVPEGCALRFKQLAKRLGIDPESGENKNF